MQRPLRRPEVLSIVRPTILRFGKLSFYKLLKFFSKNITSWIKKKEKRKKLVLLKMSIMIL